MGRFRRFLWMLSRRKPMDVSEEAPTDLDRCLNTLDLTALGVGATLGFGLYVLSGEVAAQKAGPGVVLSFMIAAIASTFSALCYAEFAAKVPKSGSAYAYSYITVGEFVAFVIGWNLTLEHVIGTASLARGYSGYLGSLFDMPARINHTIEADSILPEFLHTYVSHFDSLAFFLTMLVTGLLLLGVQVSSKFQITFATINLSVACFIFVSGLFKADFHNWSLTKEEIPANAGEGGFLPFGWTGVIAGAGTCFFAFVGFDGIAATAEEVKNPRKAIPNSILWTSGIIFITYCFMATIQTLIWPYWDQKQAAPLPYIFERLNMPVAKWTVLVGVLAGLSTSFVGGFLPLPRILYAMARDGVIYRVLSRVSKRFKVPIVATIVGGILIACLASMLEIDQLADMLSIGTLAAYSLVSISVLLLRYEYKRPSNCSNPLPITFQDGQTVSGALGISAKNGVDNQLMRLAEQEANSEVKVNKLTEGNGGGKMRDDNLALAVNGVLPLVAPGANSNNNNTSNNNGKPASLLPTNKVSDSSVQTDIGQVKVKVQDGDNIGSISSSSEESGNSSSSSSSSSSSASSSGSSENAGSNYSITGSVSSRSLISLFVDGTRGPGNEIRRPDEQTTHISRIMILLLVVVITLLDFSLVIYGPTLFMKEPIALISCGGSFLLTLVLGYLLNRLPVAESTTNSFEVPMVPTIPLFSVIINTYLMLNLSVMTWIRFAVWMAIGFFIYFTYGIFKSTGYKDSRCD